MSAISSLMKFAHTSEDHLEAFDGFLEGHEFALWACEHLSHLEGLGEEPLDLSGSGHGQLVVLGQLVHTQDSNDVLQGLVVLYKYTATGQS